MMFLAALSLRTLLAAVSLCTLSLQAESVGEQRDVVRVEVTNNFWAAPCAMPPVDGVEWKVYRRPVGGTPVLIGECHPAEGATQGCLPFLHQPTECGFQYMIEAQVPLQDGGRSYMQLEVGVAGDDPRCLCGVP